VPLTATLVAAGLLAGWAATSAIVELTAGPHVAVGGDVAAGAPGVADPDALVVVPQGTPTPTPTAAASPTPTPSASVSGEATDPIARANAAAGVLPGAVPPSLGRDFAVAAGSEPAPGPGTVRTVRVEAEVGLPIDVDVFARFVMDTLNDARGWGANGSLTFARTDGEAEIRVLVASPASIDAMCAPLRTNGKWSCGRYGHAALNAVRWVEGAPAFLEADGDLTTYRQYLVNHEVGHLLGAQHTGCPAPGTLAPVMQQQSLGLNGCIPSGWPNP
jgi:hypothetical protein